MLRILFPLACMGIAVATQPGNSVGAETTPSRIFFSERFDDADPAARGWYDGRLVVEQTDVVLRSTDFFRMKFNQFLMAPYFGPGLLPHARWCALA
jgi:hypothetical protein